MRPVSSAFLAAVTRSHTLATRVDVLQNGSTILAGLSVTDGSVTIDRTADVRGRCSIVVADPALVPSDATDLLTPYGNELRVWRGVRFASTSTAVGASTDEMVSLGVFRIQSFTVDDPGRAIKIDGLDRSQAIREAAFEDVYTVPAGTPYTSAIQSLISAVLPTTQFNFAISDEQAPLLVFDDVGEGGRWSAATSMAASLGCELYFDGDGTCVLRPDTSAIAASVLTVTDGVGGVIVAGSKGWARDGMYNAVVATSNNPTGALSARGFAYDSDPNSPTYYFGPFGKKIRHYASPFIATQDQAESAALSILQQNLGASQALKFTIAPNPALEPGDVITVQRGALGVNQTVVVDSVSVGLQASSAMEADVRILRGSGITLPVTPTPAPPPVTPIPPTIGTRILWGIGDEISGGAYANTSTYQDAKINLVSAWFNGQGDISFFTSVPRATIDAIYSDGKSIEVIIWLANETAYAVSDQFVMNDLPNIIDCYKGAGDLYVVMYTELETYYDKATLAGRQYRDSLKTAYYNAIDIIHGRAPRAKVGLGFTGQFWAGSLGTTRNLKYYQDGKGSTISGSTNDDAATVNAYTSADVLAKSDFLCTQQMQSGVGGDTILLQTIPNAIAQFHSLYPSMPQMISHFKVWDDPKPVTTTSQANAVASFGNIVDAIFNEDTIKSYAAQGFFAWNFMTDHYINNPGPVHDKAVAFINTHYTSPAKASPPAAYNPSAPQRIYRNDFRSGLREFTARTSGTGYPVTNGSVHLYRPQQVTTGSTGLIIEAEKVGAQWYSGLIDTRYGLDFIGPIRCRIRCRMSTATGMWPTLWWKPQPVSTASEAGAYGSWPSSGEWDVFESISNSRFYWTIHGDNPLGSKTHWQLPATSNFTTGVDVTQWHIIESDWVPGVRFSWYLDGVKVKEVTSWPNMPIPYDKRFYPILNMAVGSNITGFTPMPDGTTPLSGNLYEVDYFEVYSIDPDAAYAPLP